MCVVAIEDVDSAFGNTSKTKKKCKKAKKKDEDGEASEDEDETGGLQEQGLSIENLAEALEGKNRQPVNGRLILMTTNTEVDPELRT